MDITLDSMRICVWLFPSSIFLIASAEISMSAEAKISTEKKSPKKNGVLLLDFCGSSTAPDTTLRKCLGLTTRYYADIFHVVCVTIWKYVMQNDTLRPSQNDCPCSNLGGCTVLNMYEYT